MKRRDLLFGAPAAMAVRASANDRIRLACIGVGRMGSGNLRGFLRYPDVRVAAVCESATGVTGPPKADLPVNSLSCTSPLRRLHWAPDTGGFAFGGPVAHGVQRL